MTNYYCLVAGLPDISLDDDKLSFTVADFRQEVYPGLSRGDRALVDVFYYRYDNEALLGLLEDSDAPVRGGGVFSHDELLSLISQVKEGESESYDGRFPSYMPRFLEWYFGLDVKPGAGRLADRLAALYFEFATGVGNRFTAAWFEFNLNLNNILTALSGRRHDIDVSEAIVGDNEVAEALRSSRARDFGLSDSLDYYERLQRAADSSDILERERRVDVLKWEWIDEAVFFDYFSVERVYAFLLRTDMIERWLSLDAGLGGEMFRKMIKKLREDVSIPAEFKN